MGLAGAKRDSRSYTGTFAKCAVLTLQAFESWDILLTLLPFTVFQQQTFSTSVGILACFSHVTCYQAYRKNM